ncbi:hypothetical protein KGM_209631 [Danaus plexippus plexippus]|uniref:WW domain binding protein VOPP1 n=1 Tax=Danaus plexippus plexippus TaxID=278856 RepID=A0A212FET6_DANPL|nr:hypothetical protein KGM_209631 [Danaus plexippus plexippus]
MIFFCLAVSMLGVILTKPACAAATPCGGGRLCPPDWFCCGDDCCAPPTFNTRRIANDSLREVFVTSWYSQWQVLFLLVTLGGIALCCAWCLYRRPSCACSLSCCTRARSERDSAGSVCAPPRYSRCGSVHQAPPPYAEVTSKPDLYPLVITCGEGDGKAGGSYLMVHYFRNYVIRAPGSLSATSTAESLNSSFICNAANEADTHTLSDPKTLTSENTTTHYDRPTRAHIALPEANTMIPPPYSCASSCSCARGLRDLGLTDERRRDHAITPDQNYDLELELIDCEMYCDGGCKPRLGSSPPPRRSSPSADDSYCERAAYLRHLFLTSPDTPGGCESPPQPTSPTQSRESTLRRQIDERCQRRHDFLRRPPRTRKSSLYIPLSKVPPGSRKFLTRSAPVTPSGALVPNLLSFTQRVSASRLSSKSSRLEEENDPLLIDGEAADTDHKF